MDIFIVKIILEFTTVSILLMEEYLATPILGQTAIASQDHPLATAAQNSPPR